MDIKIIVDASNQSSYSQHYKICIPFADLEISKNLSERDLNDLLEQIETVLGYKSIMEKFDCSLKEAMEIKDEYQDDEEINSLESIIKKLNCTLKEAMEVKNHYRSLSFFEIYPIENKHKDDKETALKSIMDKFNCSVKEAIEIEDHIDENIDCQNCDLKLKECYRCCKVCESPLETTLFKELIRQGINPELQLRINKDNTISHFPEPVDSAKILTRPDFYIETDRKKICIYTDGHSYHERTENQAVRDRSIDRNLQNLGYVVLRYTTSEINEKLSDVIEDIKKTMRN